MPYSLSTSGNAPNVAVSTPSTPDREELVVHLRDEVGAGERRDARCSLRAPRRRSRRGRGPGPASTCRTRRRARGRARAARRGTGARRRCRSALRFPAGRTSPQVTWRLRNGSTRFRTTGVVGCRFGMKVYTRTGDDGTTGLLYGGRVGKDDVGPEAYGAVDEAVSALGLARAVDRPGLGAPRAARSDCSASCSWSVPSSRPRRRTGPSSRRRYRSSRPRWSTRLEPIIDDVTGRFDPPTEFVLPGENAIAAALDFARTVIRRAERATVAATRVGWLGAESQVVPYLNRLADLVYTLSRWQEGDFRPLTQTVRTSMAPTFEIASGAPRSRPARRPRLLRRATRTRRRRSSTTRSAGRSPTSCSETDFDGKRGEVLAVPTGGRLGARAALLLGIGRRRHVRPRGAAARRRACSLVARRAPRRVATTLLDAIGPDVDRGARRAGVRRGRVPRQLPVPAVQVRRQGVAARRASSSSGAANAKVRAGLDRGARIARGRRVGARPRSTSRPRRSRRPTSPISRKGVARTIGVEGEGVRGRAAGPRADGRRDRRGQRLGAPAALPAARVRARARPRHARLRRQGRRLRLRRPVAQDGGRHGDDEDRHVGRGRGDRGDVDVARSRREGAGASATSRSSRTCRAGRRCAPATC